MHVKVSPTGLRAFRIVVVVARMCENAYQVSIPMVVGRMWKNAYQVLLIPSLSTSWTHDLGRGILVDNTYQYNGYQ